jgi:tetratricopeptide (TPR) repeat protein
MAHRGLDETEEERALLEQWAKRDSDALEAYHRLMELAEQDRDWDVVFRNAERFLAVNPLVPQPYRFLARASEELNRSHSAITAYQKLLLLDPIDPAGVHFRLGRLLHLNNDPSAKRQVLLALEEAPRFREAHRLLLEMARADNSQTNKPVPKVLDSFQ